MSEDKIYSALIEISQTLGAVQQSQKNIDDKMNGVCTRLDTLEQKPAKRIEGGVMALISAIVAAVVGAVTSLFTRHV